MNPRITQADVAKEAGVHSTTVSLALRNHPSLPIETRQRIQALAEKIGYRPDPDLRSLMSYRRSMSGEKKHPSTLAYVTNWHSKMGWKQWPAHAQFYEGAGKRAPQLGYQLEHFWLGEPGLSDQRLGDILVARGIQGAIIASYSPDFDRPLQLDWTRLSAVKIGFFPSKPKLHTITNDQSAIIRLAMRRAKEAGYRRIGFVLPQEFDEFVDLAWSAGFLAEQQKAAPDDRIPILRYPTPIASSAAPYCGDLVPRRTLEDWLQAYKPEVLISWGPFLLPRLRELGLSVPSDIAYADVFLEDTNDSLAGVHQNCQRVGACAVEAIADQIEHHVVGIQTVSKTTLIEGTWIDGASLPRRVPMAMSSLGGP
ncbi:MAG: LacI family DNA-binding transcriptional regulator [Verrucomicrobia bacterium]|nr:LacI family DNA-binding transcriptional regulator [Verrucomicrobiota bacterium]